MELNGLAVRLQTQCFPSTCTQMTATEQWIFLCAAHKTPKECPAIDYTRHTLDGAACLLNSNKYFPSRWVQQAFVHVAPCHMKIRQLSESPSKSRQCLSSDLCVVEFIESFRTHISIIVEYSMNLRRRRHCACASPTLSRNTISCRRTI